MKRDEYLERLRAIGAQRAEAQRLRAQVAKDTRSLVPRARKAGIPVREIAEALDVSDKAVYKLLSDSSS